MTGPYPRVALCVLPLLTLMVGCGAQMNAGADRRYDDLRSLVLEQRRAIEDLRREQESVRAAIDKLQYGRRSASGRPVYGPSGGPAASDDSYWQRAVSPTGEQPAAVASVPGAPAAAGTPEPAPEPASSGSGNGVPPDLVGTAYDSAVRQLAAGDHDEAIQSFRNYLHENGSSAYADDAQFLIGESYFRKGQYHRAIIEFNQVSINYGSGDRAPSALLRQAEAFRIVGDRVDARLSLQKVINRYPGTGEAAKASRMLTEIGG